MTDTSQQQTAHP